MAAATIASRSQPSTARSSSVDSGADDGSLKTSSHALENSTCRRTRRKDSRPLVGRLARSSGGGVRRHSVMALGRTAAGAPTADLRGNQRYRLLSPGLPSHTKQTEGLLLGVATGIVIGELSLALPDGIPLLRITIAAFLAMIVAASYGQPAVVPIQAGVSAILLVAFGPATEGFLRMADVAVGAAVGLLFSQVLAAANQNRLAKAA